jgi:transposase
MINYETFCKIKTLQKMSLTANQIATACSLNEKSVRRYLKIERFTARKSTPRASRLDPFKERIRQWLDQYPYSAAQVHERLRQEDYHGSYSTVKQFVRIVRPPKRSAFLTLAFAPGECAQVDWGNAGFIQIGSITRRLSFFVAVLCYSRMIFVRFSLSQTIEHWLQCHRDVFEFLGGVPKRIMVDNCKTAVIHRPPGQPPVFNDRYLQFAHHYGFEISPCNIASGHEKGQTG